MQIELSHIHSKLALRWAHPAAQVPIVFYHGGVITVDEKFSIAPAIAVRDGQILKVGNSDTMLKFAGPKTRKIDLKGRGVIPGLIDSHSHAQATAADRDGKELAELPGQFACMRVSDAKNLVSGKEDVRAVVRKAKPGAQSLPLKELDKRHAEIPKAGRAVLYCACPPGNVEEGYAYQLLRDLGYRNVSVLEGGITEWRKRGYPMETNGGP